MPSPTTTLPPVNASTPSAKRLMQEWRHLRQENSPHYEAAPLEDNLFEWHFTLRGQPDTDFAGGKYHGRILLPSEYPLKPPSVIFLTPNGRFQLHKKICLSMTQYHPESWQPAWDLRCILLALISFMPSEVSNSVGDINYSTEQRQQLAKDSHHWQCPQCHLSMSEVLLADPSTDSTSSDGTSSRPAITTDNIPLMALQYSPSSKPADAPDDQFASPALVPLDADPTTSSSSSTPSTRPAMVTLNAAQRGTGVARPDNEYTNVLSTVPKDQQELHSSWNKHSSAGKTSQSASPLDSSSSSGGGALSGLHGRAAQVTSSSATPKVFGLNNRQWDAIIVVLLIILVTMLFCKCSA